MSLSKRKTSNMSTYILFGNFEIFTAKFFVKWDKLLYIGCLDIDLTELKKQSC